MEVRAEFRIQNIAQLQKPARVGSPHVRAQPPYTLNASAAFRPRQTHVVSFLQIKWRNNPRRYSFVRTAAASRGNFSAFARIAARRALLSKKGSARQPRLTARSPVFRAHSPNAKRSRFRK